MSDNRPWFVTGAAGFLGSHVIDECLRRGRNIVAIDNLSWGKAEHLAAAQPGAMQLVVADIRDADGTAKLFARYRPQAVIHLAALHYIPAAIADPPLAVGINVQGTESVLSAAAAAGVERLYFASTGDVYAPQEGALREDSPIAPFNIYGLTKLMGEQLVALAARNRPELCAVVGRLFNLYGPRETNPHLLPEILKQIRQRPDAPLQLGSLWPRRDMVPVMEAARAVVELVERAAPGVTTVNVATGQARTMQQVVDLLGELRGRPLVVETDPSRIRAVERPHLQADVAKLHSMLGWTPSADLKQGLEALLKAEPLQ